jgi:hypothetical protein
MALIKASATAKLLLVIFVFCTLCAGQNARYFKAECFTSAGYLKLGGDGTYTVTWREHMGIFVQEQGRWDQKGAVISLSPTKPTKAPYKGTEVTYNGKTFLSWAAEGAAGIVIPSEETKEELDRDPERLPSLVFFKTTAEVYQRETKQTYPFRFLRNKP